MTLQFVDSALPRPLAPIPSRFTGPFWEALHQGRFTTTRCRRCASLTFPPRANCPGCGHGQSDWIELSGRGRLYSRTRVHSAGGSFAWQAPYSVGIVDLDEGVRLLTRLLPPAGSLPLDARVQLVVLMHADGLLFAAVPAAD